MTSLQQYSFNCYCRAHGVLRNQLTLDKINDIVSFSFYNLECRKCLMTGKNDFIEKPLWLFVEING